MAPSSSFGKDEDRLAKSVLSRTVRVRPNENVLIESWPSALPWALAFVRECRRRGAKPFLFYEDEATYWDSVRAGESARLGQPGKHEWSALAQADVYIYFWGPEDRERFRGLPDKVQENLVAFNLRWYDAASKAGVRGCRMEIARVTKKNAAAAGVDPARWKNEILRASLVDPRRLARSANRLARVLTKGRRVVVRHSNGTNVEFRLAGRKPRIYDALLTPSILRQPFRMLTNVPSGATVVALDESSGEGTVVANRVSYLPSGVSAGGRWRFEAGRLVSQTYSKGESIILKEFRTQGKGRDTPGILTIGVNPEVRMAPECEDLEQGAALVSVGGNRFFGGKTSIPFSNWVVVGGAEVIVDGTPIARGGRLL